LALNGGISTEDSIFGNGGVDHYNPKSIVIYESTADEMEMHSKIKEEY
jgi:hypothetical protein